MKIKRAIYSRCLLSLVFAFMLCFFGFSQTPRVKVNINSNWQYVADDKLNFEDVLQLKNWTTINLPHTWNALDATDNVPGYRRGTGWYKKNVYTEKVSKDLEYALYFEGANITTTVYVNGREVDTHVGGYIGFNMEITSYINEGDNEVLVRVDNSYNPEIIPSQKSDFFIYGGITRDVWLKITPKNQISKVIVKTPEVSKEQATLVLDLSLSENFETTDKLQAVLFGPNGNKIQTTSSVVLKSGKAKLSFKTIHNPLLWDVETPNLYTVKVSLLNNKKLIDEVEETVGFRWFEFKKNGPFFLNGKRVLLRGTHRHEEHAGFGAAMPNELHQKDIRDIKEMGANFVRLAHYPQDPEVYKMCDKLGLLVWDELPWCRGGIGNDEWKKNTKNQLKEMINQNINHPSIIIWSLGNEIYWLPDFENGDDETEMNNFLQELNDLSHELDPTRKTAIRKYYPGSHIVDVFSPSIWSGWYSGSYTTYQKAIDKYIKEYPHFFHAEYGGSSHVGRHTDTPIDGRNVDDTSGWTEAITQTGVKNIAQIGDWSENYIVDLFDWHLKTSESNDKFVGNIQWAFKDFGTPLRPENDIPYINQKGIMDREGNPKDAYYVLKSYWAKKPFVYIESHTWKERQGPKDKSREISVYSNCENVELFVNGNSLGTKVKDISKFPACGLTWDVNFEEGTNQLKAIGTKNGENFEDLLEVSYRYQINGVANSLSLTYDKLPNGNYLVTATAKDKQGLRCLDYEKRVYFQCLSGGEMKKHLGTPTGSESIRMANGKAQIEVKPHDGNSAISMMVMNQSFKGTYLTISR